MFHIGNEPRECVWLHPSLPGGHLTLDLPSLSAGVAHLGYGFVYTAEARARAPVKVSVEQGDTTLSVFEHQPGSGWGETKVALPAGQSRLKVESRNNGGARLPGP